MATRIRWEACDDGNNTDDELCSADCRVEGQGCGNGRVENTEQCDDGDLSDDNSCLSTCMPAECGDGIVSPQASYPEQCDPGSPGVDTAQCTRTCRLSTCGDRYINIQAGEHCEDGNSDNCGTCNKTCEFRHAPTRAFGFIDAAAAAKITAGETFTLDDGRHPQVVFEFTNGNAAQGRIKIPLQGTAHEMAQAILSAIADVNNLDFDLLLNTDPNENDQVLLWHKYPTSLGNRAITHTAHDESFYVEGMQGGAAGNCPATMGCTVDEDCRPQLHCRSGFCARVTR